MTSRPFLNELWALHYFWASLLDFDRTDHLPSSFGFDISHTCYFSFYLRFPACFSCPSLYILSPIPFYYFPAFISLFPPTFTCFSLLCAKCTSQSPSFLYLSFRLWVATPRYYKYLVLATQNGKGAQSGPSPQFLSPQFPLSLSSQFWSFGVLFSFRILLVFSESHSGCLLGLSHLQQPSYPFSQTCQNSSKTHQQIFEGVLLYTTGLNPLSPTSVSLSPLWAPLECRHDTRIKFPQTPPSSSPRLCHLLIHLCSLPPLPTSIPTFISTIKTHDLSSD